MNPTPFWIMRRMAARIIAGVYIGLPIDGWNSVDGEMKGSVGSKRGDAADFVFGWRFFNFIQTVI